MQTMIGARHEMRLQEDTTNGYSKPGDAVIGKYCELPVVLDRGVSKNGV